MSTITVYTTPTCVYCNTLKEYFNSKDIKFKEIDVSKDEKALEKMVDISGQMGVPVVDIDGDIVIGFDRQTIDDLLKIK